MTLLHMNVGEWATVGHITQPDLHLSAMRLGVCEGARLQLKAKIPGGPLVFACGSVELALGRELCAHIAAMPA